ncbi:MAG TPA: N-acetyl-gamma-glutamyl-phosphate reductase [Thermoplasmata archaeon]|nr:N-acetyl-gamma-glutamyl-phosphate reductase [Thermoplasmata archaeon]
MKATVLGASGYVGGELLRLLLRHSDMEIGQAISDSMAGKAVSRVHPNLRKATDLVFAPRSALRPADVTFVAAPHGEVMDDLPTLLGTGGIVIDLSADHRLKDPARYPEYYHREHPHPELLASSVLGLPELHRDALRTAPLIAVPGCIATASILALRPLVAAGLVDPSRVVIDAKSGSSASGRDAGPAGQHAERAGVIRAYAPAGHRHTAEIEQETGARVALSCHAVEAVRGVLATVHGFTPRPVEEKELWRTYRAAYGAEPFVRIVHESDGIHREPEPKILSGTNYCDLGFAVDPHADRIVALGALDNLMKGAAGNAVQCLNVRAGFPETRGLEFLGLHPI